MSEHRKDEPTLPTIPDRLPGEAELSGLYRENADEQPSVVQDQLILHEARKAVQPPSHLRLISRRWTVPLTLAAGLLVSIGVMTTLEVKTHAPVYLSDQEATFDNVGKRQAVLSPQKEQRAESKAVEALSLKQEAVPLPIEELLGHQEKALTDSLIQKRKPSRRSRSDRALGPVTPSSPAAAPVLDERDIMIKKAIRELQRKTGFHRRMARCLVQEERAEELSQARSRGSSVLAEEGIRDACSPDVWLSEITDLLQAGHRSEAEKSFQFFRRRYPSVADFPDDFPQELLR